MGSILKARVLQALEAFKVRFFHTSGLSQVLAKIMIDKPFGLKGSPGGPMTDDKNYEIIHKTARYVAT